MTIPEKTRLLGPLGSICKSFVFPRNLSEGSREGERNNDNDGGGGIWGERVGEREREKGEMNTVGTY